MKAENIMLTLAVGQINIGHTSNLFLTGSRPDKYRSTFSFSSESSLFGLLLEEDESSDIYLTYC
jgi:hypothetical protein